MDKQALIQALETELAGYLRRGLTDRAKAVQQELSRLGGSPASPAEEAVPVEAAGTPQKAAKRVRKPVEASKPAKGTTTAKRSKKP